METKDFYYDLPKELIAQTPVEPRDSSRLLVMNKTSGELEHRHFYDITEYLQPGDCLIVNDSRVLPARIYGSKKDTGGHIEFLLLTQKEQDVWEVLAKPGRKAQPGTWFVLEKACWKLRCWKFWKMERDWFVFIIRGIFMLC